MTSHLDVMAFLRELGLDEELETFSGRIRIQKTVYLLKAFGANMKFGYRWYYRGCYSPLLTKTLFESDPPGQRAERDLSSHELRIVSEVRKFLEQDFYSADRMELIASLLYLVRHGSDYGLTTKGEVVGFLREEKPRYTLQEIEEVWDRIVKARRWDDYLAKFR